MNVVSIIYCLSEFEFLTALLYEELSRRASEKKLSSSIIFKLISLESRNHSIILKEVLARLKADVQPLQCEELVGEPWRRIKLLQTRMDELKDYPLRDILRELEFIEGFVGEESYVKLILPLLKNEVFENIKDLREITELVIRKIIEDERYHERLVMRVKELFEKS